MAKQTLLSTDNGANSLTKINANFDENYSSISTIEGDISTIEGDISTIEGDISTIEGALPTGTIVGTSDTQTLTNKTITLPTFTNGAINFNAPEGFLINGKISVTVASNNITVAIKTLAGTDPSATDPVYVRINGVIRAITSALSVTKNAGTNWCNAGSSELATREIDYFVYLGYNATDGVVIGFSRIPYACSYDDFSTTTTNEKYCAISTITNATATDYYNVIGRFAATLSAGAGYTWSVPTFTAKNLIQRPIYETRRLVWLPTYAGFSSNPTGTGVYTVCGCSLILYLNSGDGTSNATGFTFTVPFVPAVAEVLIVRMKDNSAWTGGIISSSSSNTTITAYKDTVGNAFTNSGAKATQAGFTLFLN